MPRSRPVVADALITHCDRKPTYWHEVSLLSSAVQGHWSAALEALPVFPLPAVAHWELGREAAEAGVFIGTFGRDRFFVDTQGYDYARYAVRLGAAV